MPFMALSLAVWAAAVPGAAPEGAGDRPAGQEAPKVVLRLGGPAETAGTSLALGG